MLAAIRAKAQIAVDVTRIGDATHLEFTGASEWKYDLKRDGGNVVLRVPGMKPEALARLRTVSDNLIKKIQVNEKGVDNSAEITFQVTNAADFFDYISDQPSRLIVDFFPKEGPAEGKAAPKQETKQPAGASAKPAAPLPPKLAANRSKATKDGDQDEDEDEDGKSGDRLPAADGLYVARGVLPAAPTLAEQLSSKKDFNHGIFDGGDPEFRRFTIKDYEIREDAIIASRANYYLAFPMLELGTPQLRALVSVPPTYEIVAKDTRENQEARVLLKLFNEKQRASFLKSADEFVAEYPNSAYDEIVRYMIADAHYDIWRASNSQVDFEASMNLYLSLAEKYPDSPMAPRTLLLIGYSYLDRNDSFGALKAFQRFTRLHPNSKHIDRVRISTAEAYLKLNRFDDAFTMYDQIEKTGTTTKGREEAAYRKGDVFFRRKDYAAAIREYKAATQRFPAAVNRFANASYNTAEAEFVNGKYREALEAYRSFLRKFPDHDHGGYAMTRMGELLGILGADTPRVVGAYMESHFRYRATPGAGIARIRMLTSRMPEMKEKELESALREVDEISTKYANRPRSESADKKAADGKAKAAESGGNTGDAVTKQDEFRLALKDGEFVNFRRPELPGIEEFSTLLIADGFTARREYDDSAKTLISYFQKNPQSPNKEKLRTRIARNISDAIRASVERGDFIDALRRYSKDAGGWLKNSGRIDVRYNVGRAYEQAGVFKEAEKVYKECLQSLNAIKGSPAEREHNVFEVLPKMDAVELRLAAVSAKAGDYLAAESHLKKIAATGALLSDTEQVERAEVSADVAESRGRPDVARKYLTELVKAWKAEPQLTSPLHLRLARLEMKSKNNRAADAHIQKLLVWKKQEGSLVSDDLHAKALELRGDMMVARGRRSEGIKSYRELLEKYEAKRPLESVRYRLGQILYEDGDLKGAEVVWNQLKPAKENLWQRLATEQMQGAKWQNEYKKYLNRIPAAAELRDTSTSETR